MEFLDFGEIFRGAERANYIHDKYNIDYVQYKHTHKLKYHLHYNT